MSDGSQFDPIFAEQPVPPAEGHQREEHRPAGADWVVVHRGGAGSKAHVEALERKLIKAKIRTKLEHDDEGRIVLEVPRDSESEALAALGDGNTHGAGETAHRTREQRIESSEREELHGAFAATKSKWLIWTLVIVVLALLAGWFFIYWPLFHR